MASRPSRQQSQSDAVGVGRPPEADASLLELPTKLDNPVRPGWWFNVYLDAGEAGGCFHYSLPAQRVPGWAEVGEGVDQERSAAEAARRAKGQVRRYCATHRLNRLGSLTYRGEGCHDPRQVRHDVGRFFVGLRRRLGRGSFPYVWVPEWHPKGHGLHLHFAVGQYVDRSLLVSSWPHGFVHIKLLGDLPVGSGSLGEARAAARYLGKYISKDPAAGSGLHRYEVAQGFQPVARRVWGPTSHAAIAEASRLFGRAPEYVWNSDQDETWSGPPAGWASWPG